MRVDASRQARGYRHEAMFYDGDRSFVEDVSTFLRDGVESDEPALAVVSARKIGLLRDALGAHAGRVGFVDMEELGANPARLIPAWRAFVDDHRGRSVRGVGEPIWAGRSPPELAECRSHESLLNRAFAESPAFWLVCAYDRSSLDSVVLDEAARTHPFVRDGHSTADSRLYRGPDVSDDVFAGALPEPSVTVAHLSIDGSSFGSIRAFVLEHALAAGMGAARASDLVLAAHEVVANSWRHGGGDGALRMWVDGDHVWCDVRDAGVIRDPLAGRVRPSAQATGGRGLWLANQLCDLVQIRTTPAGSAVRLLMRM